MPPTLSRPSCRYSAPREPGRRVLVSACLKEELGDHKDVPRAKKSTYIPVVLSREEIAEIMTPFLPSLSVDRKGSVQVRTSSVRSREGAGEGPQFRCRSADDKGPR